MKVNHCIESLVLLLSLLFYNDASAQNIRGDTIYVDEKSVVTVVFPAEPSGLFADRQEGLYVVSDMGKNALGIRALKKGVKEQGLEVAEGGRKHLFILSYIEGSPALRIDLATKKKISARVDKVKKDVSKALNTAKNLYDQTKSDSSNQALWENAEAAYLKLVNAVDAKDAGVVKSRLEEIHTHIQGIKEMKYGEAMKEGQNYFSLKQYNEARKAYLKAREYKPGDVQALKYINLTDSVWAKEYVDKGDDARKVKKYIDAKTAYNEAYNIKPDYPFLQNKIDLIKKDADPLIYKYEKEKFDQAMKAYNIEEARKAYDSAFFVYPNDRYMKSQLNRLITEEKKIEEEKRKEAEYQAILAAAKDLADKASNAQGYDLAIKEYKKALEIFSDRKFPGKKIDELTKRKKVIGAN